MKNRIYGEYDGKIQCSRGYVACFINLGSISGLDYSTGLSVRMGWKMSCRENRLPRIHLGSSLQAKRESLSIYIVMNM